jgi:hypothetical protein
VRLLVDGEELASHEGELQTLTLPTEDMQASEHRLQVEARLADGRRLRSEPVRIVVVAGD